jgi:hypothetical protein
MYIYKQTLTLAFAPTEEREGRDGGRLRGKIASTVRNMWDTYINILRDVGYIYIYIYISRQRGRGRRKVARPFSSFKNLDKDVYVSMT